MNIYTQEQKELFFKVSGFDKKVLQNVRKIIDSDEIVTNRNIFNELKYNNKFYMVLGEGMEDRIELEHFAELMACIDLELTFEIV